MAGETYKRGFTRQEAMEYVGVKRRTWDTLWEPRLVGMPQGVCVIFDRQDLDRVFDEFKAAAAQGLPVPNDRVAGGQVAAGYGRGNTSSFPARRALQNMSELDPPSRTVGGEFASVVALVKEMKARQKELKPKK